MTKVDMLDEAHATMDMFFGACGYETGAHEVQTMWFEVHFGKSNMRQANYRKALKDFNHVDRHLEAMVNGQYDYYLYSIRKYSLQGFEEMVELTDHTLL